MLQSILLVNVPPFLFSQLMNVNASLNSVLQIEINPIMRISNEGNELGMSRIVDKGIKIMSNKNIVLYGINKKQFSTDGFLALPTSVIGKIDIKIN